jgi:hypothetical protein
MMGLIPQENTMPLIFLLALPTAWTSPSPDCPPPLMGAWEYRQRAGDGYDAEGERLQLSCSDKVLKGLYYGLEREGEHGLFYTLVEVTDLKVGAGGGLSFTVPGRELFYERPKDLQEVTGKKLESAGFTRDELYIQGPLKDGNLVLSCASKAGSCPENVMVFGKSP